MPHKCCIIGCKGNYQYGPKVHVFSFPKKEELKRKWICAIPRKNFTPSKHSRVCERHFKENEIIREATGFDEKTGKTLTAPLKHVKLLSDAVPSQCLVFPNNKLSSSRKSRRRSPDERRKKLESDALLHALTESLRTKAKYDAKNDSLDSASLDKNTVTQVDSETCKESLSEEENTGLPIITLVESHAHHKGQWLDDDFNLKVESPEEQYGDDEILAEKLVWKQDAVQLLIEHYRCYKELLKSGCMKKDDMWKKIAQSMQKQGYGVTGEMCDKKWHSLFSIYKVCIENNGIIGHGRKKWQYYEQFHELYWKDIVSIIDSQIRGKLNAGVQTTSEFNKCSSLEHEPTCSSTTSLSPEIIMLPLPTDSINTLLNVPKKRMKNLETDDDGSLLQILRKKHESDTLWQLQMKELVFKSLKIQEQTNEALSKLTEILIKYINKH